jgi:small subunit ribosomal protein S6e
MKLNIAFPQAGTQKVIDIDDDKKLSPLNDKRLGNEFDAGFLGEEFKGYVFRITGGQDKQGFPMKQGVMANSRVSLLLARGTVGFCSHRGRKGERRRKSVRGCIIANDIALLNLVIVQKGEADLAGITDTQLPRRLGPKRASKIRKLFALGKEDDVRKFVIKRQLPQKEGKKQKVKAPKIQRLVTPVALQRRRRKKAALKNRREKGADARKAYQDLVNRRAQAAFLRKRATASRQRSAKLAQLREKK